MQEYNINNYLDGVKKIGMCGHIRPDGDCVGSCLGLYTYLKNNYSEIDVDLYLEPIADKFKFLKYSDEIINNADADKEYDLFIVLDCSAIDRIGEFAKYFNSASKTLCIDHHVSNTEFADVNIVYPDYSSASEVVFTLLDREISYDTACALYLGIIHDTGVLKYQSTSAQTMEIAGKLMSKGIPFTDIIDDTFYSKTYVQNQILGRALLESVLFYDGKCIFSVVKKDEFEFYNISSSDLDGIVEQLRITKGVECAIFLYETAPLEYKVSLRSNDLIDVSKIATYFGGGGHKRAAGFCAKGTVYDVINNISEQIELQIEKEQDNI